MFWIPPPFQFASDTLVYYTHDKCALNGYKATFETLFIFNKLEPFTKECFVWLKLAQWWLRRRKCEKFTGRQKDRLSEMLSFGSVELKRLTFISNLREKEKERQRERERVLSIIHTKFIQKLCKYLVNLSELNFLIEICPLSVVVVHIFVFSSSHWANLNQTCHKAFLGESYSSLFKWRAWPFSKGK